MNERAGSPQPTRSEARQGSAAGPEEDRDPLHDWSAECEVLGRLIGDAALVAEALRDGLTDGAFHLDRHRLIYSALCGLSPEDHAGGLPAVVHALRRSGELDLVGGPSAVALVLDSRVSAAENARWEWRKRLVPLQRAREVVRACEGAARRIRECPDDAVQVIRETVARLDALYPCEAPRG